MATNYGYCCINLTLEKERGIKIGRSIIKKTFQAKGIKYAGELAEANLRDMIEIIKWNEQNGFKVYRMSSDMFPWMSEYELEDLPDFKKISILLQGAGRTNATPALNDGNIFIGDSNNVSTTITLNTTNVPEGTNLYYTDTRFDTRLATKTTNDLSEGPSNLYHTSTRVNSLIDTRVTKTFVDALNVDADTLDGLNSTQFLRSDVDDTHLGNLTIDSDVTVGGVLYGPSTFYIDPAPVDSDAGTLIIRGNLQVQGTQTTINSTTVSLNDLNLVLADSAANAAAADGAGITINGAAATLTYAATGDKFVFNKAPYLNTDRLLTAADLGAGNGLDADTVDGQHYDDIISEATALAIALG